MDLILFMLGGIGVIASIIWAIVSLLRKKFDKRSLITLGLFTVMFFVGLSMPPERSEEVVDEEKVVREGVEEEEDDIGEPLEEKVEEVVEEQEVEEDSNSESTWDDMKENIVGVSDKDFKKVIESSPTDVTNDTTGNWKKLVISKGLDIEEYAASYAKTNMKKDEIHFIIDLGRNTTTSINKMGGLLYVDIMEYVDKEEHDANKLGSGMLLQSYIIYPDGDIEKVEY